MKYQKGMRVDVVTGDGEEPLGLGTYTGDVSVYAFIKSDGSIISSNNAEERPPQSFIDQMQLEGADLVELEDNPRIELDSGRVVYGCQVWWSPITETINETAH